MSGVNQCIDLEEELLAFPKSPNDDTSDCAAYQVEIAQLPAGGRGHGRDAPATYAEPVTMTAFSGSARSVIRFGR